MFRFNVLRVFSGFCLLFSPLVFAYDCDNLSEFSWGGNIVQGSVYRSHDGAYECTTNWCSWVEPGGNNNYWNQAWTFLGECESGDPVNSAPEVSVVNPWDMVVGETQHFQATASDADGDIVSWELVIYRDTTDGLQNPEVIDSGTGDMLATVVTQGSWTAQSNDSFMLVTRVTDSNGETTTVAEPFVVAETPNSTLSLNHPKVILVGQVGTVSTTVVHSLNVPPAARLSYESEGEFTRGSTSSSSSGGSGTGYMVYKQETVQPHTDADITVTATVSAYGLEETGFIEVLPADGLPEIAADVPASIAEGETVEIIVSAKDKDGIDNFQVTLNGNDMLAAATVSYIGGDTAENAYGIQATFNWTAQAGAHLLQVIASDNNDNTVDDLVEFEVDDETSSEEPDASIDVGHVATAWVEDRFKIIVTSYHSTQIAMPTFTVVHDETGEAVASSSSSPSASSSSSSGGGYHFVREYWVTSDKVGAHTITTVFSDAPSATSVTSIDILDGADRTPELTLTAPDSADYGDSVSIGVVVEGFYHVESLQLFIGGQLIEPDQSSSSSVYQIANDYLWLASEGSHVLHAVATGGDGATVETTQSITVVGEPMEGSCQAVGINMDSVHAYPNWPHNDWKGDPNNANSGDLMSYDGSVYRANWWTTTLPGSDGSWTWICDL